MDSITSIDQARPNPDAFFTQPVKSEAESALLVTMCSFYSPKISGDMMKTLHVSSFEEILARLNFEERKILTKMKMNYPGEFVYTPNPEVKKNVTGASVH